MTATCVTYSPGLAQGYMGPLTPPLSLPLEKVYVYVTLMLLGGIYVFIDILFI